MSVRRSLVAWVLSVCGGLGCGATRLALAPAALPGEAHDAADARLLVFLDEADDERRALSPESLTDAGLKQAQARLVEAYIARTKAGGAR